MAERYSLKGSQGPCGLCMHINNRFECTLDRQSQPKREFGAVCNMSRIHPNGHKEFSYAELSDIETFSMWKLFNPRG